jgi:ComF family protein
MARAGRALLDDADLLLPVPLHRWRLFWRTYNQSAILARHIHNQTTVEVRFDVLRRVKATPSQGRLSAGARRRNVSGAFEVRTPDIVADRHVVLVDDVLTTGAMLNACARVLRQAGARRVDALVAACVPAPVA